MNNKDLKVSVNELNHNDASDTTIGSILLQNVDVPRSPRYKYHKCRGKIFERPSRLIPDQSYTVQELYDRALIQSAPEVARVSYYDEQHRDEDRWFAKSGIDINQLDLVELDAMNDFLRNKITHIRSRMAKQKEKQEKSETD